MAILFIFHFFVLQFHSQSTALTFDDLRLIFDLTVYSEKRISNKKINGKIIDFLPSTVEQRSEIIWYAENLDQEWMRVEDSDFLLAFYNRFSDCLKVKAFYKGMTHKNVKTTHNFIFLFLI